MKRVWVFVLVSALLVAPAVASELEERATPSLYAGFSFGGASATRDARLGLRVEAPVHWGERIEMARWELRGDAAEFALAGLPVVTRSWGPNYGEDGPPASGGQSKVSWIVLGTVATVAIAATLVHQVDEAFEDSMEENGDDVALAMMGFEDSEDGGDAEEPESCETVEVVDNCVGGGG